MRVDVAVRTFLRDYALGIGYKEAEGELFYSKLDEMDG